MKRSTVALASAALALSACSSSSGGSSSPAPSPLAPDTSTFTATWKGNTVVLDAPTVTTNLQNPTTADGLYRFAPTFTQASSWVAGQALVLTGVDFVKVDSVTVQSDAILVQTEPASFVDAVTDADGAWSIGADMSKAPPGLEASNAPISIAADPTLVCNPGTDGGTCDPKMSFSGTLGNLSASQSFGFGADGSLTGKASLKLDTDGAVLGVAATLTLKSFRDDGALSIHNGTVTGWFAADDLDLQVDLDMGGVNLGVSDDTFTFPLSVTFPFSIGPVPAYFTVSLSIGLNPSLANMTTASSHLVEHVAGSLRLDVNGTNVTGSGTVDVVPGDAPTVTDSQSVSVVTAGMGVLLQYPKVALGLGVAKVASLEGYFVAKEELVVNDAVQFSSLGLITGNCLTVNADIGTYYGGKFRILGIGIGDEKQIFGVQRQLFQAGNPSDAVCMPATN